jgi:hypothetical protein
MLTPGALSRRTVVNSLMWIAVALPLAAQSAGDVGLQFEAETVTNTSELSNGVVAQ